MPSFFFLKIGAGLDLTRLKRFERPANRSVQGPGGFLDNLADFITTAMVFEKRMKRAPTSEVPYIHHLYPLYAVSWLIMLRSVFRVIEYALGQKGYLLANEWPLFVFDAVPMVCTMVIWGYWHPGTIQQEVPRAQSLSMGRYRSIT
ncbi:uncharacterized protein LDX57_001718 [Aspergillus melleus]|uniref:uncharacterized protein n=1 Tax=Aspergillus melleus TaxID=138277 RepID=UPI001E8CEBD2|nr:uncharacterized protein LDX57_001718 [Aspergillus melleus]KAH8423962.1 hypothetical protein LDX57_001718 [Aspergillus melleus]